MAAGVLLLFTATTTWLLMSTCQAHDVHKHMTVEELRSTFHVDSHDLVPEYEVVHIHHLVHPDDVHGKRRRRTLQTNSYRDNLIETSSAEADRKAGRTPSSSNKLTAGKTSEILRLEEKLKLRAFGKPLHLSLVRNEGLLKKTGLKLWTVEPNATAQHGVEYVEIPEVHEEDIGEIYQDENHEAAILLKKNRHDGELIVEGSIGSELVIKPIPSRLKPIAQKLSKGQKKNATEPSTSSTPSKQKLNGRSKYNGVNSSKEEAEAEAQDDEMFLDDDGELSSEVAIDTGLPIRRDDKNIEEGQIRASHQHIVYKKKTPEQVEAMDDYAFMEPDHLHKRYRRSTFSNSSSHSRNKREAPYTIYPEILVIVDYDGYRLHGGDNVQIKRYFVSFWNGVDLRYKLLKGPKIRISIAGIIISRGRDATPYLERNRVGRDAIDSAAALTDMGKYLFRERRLPVYDIAVAITKYDMCRRRKGGRCTKGTAGFAYVGGACVVNKRLEKVNSVAIIEDTGGFSGIIVAAHEVGHLLGAVHDGSPPPSYLGGPGAEKCQWADGYIMSDLRHTERGFRWSPCSVSSFHHFLNGDTATCLYNSPHEDDGLPRVLPGKLLTLDAQCRKDRGTSACFKDDRVCAQLFCFDAGSGYCVAYRPAAEGSPCGDGQYCLNGRCVAEHENIIPDYTQNTPSYIRQNNQGRPLFYEDGVTPPGNYISNTVPVQGNNRPYQQPNPVTQPPTRQPPTTQAPPTQRPYYSTTQRPQYYTTSTNPPAYNNQNNNPTYKPPTHPPQSTTPKRTYYSQFTISTTRSPYNFGNFGKVNQFPSPTSTTTKRPYYPQQQVPQQQVPQQPQQPQQQPPQAPNQPQFQNPHQNQNRPAQTTKNPYVGDYYNLRKQTTKNPYDFANFGRPRVTTKNPYESNPNYHENVNNNYLKRSYNADQYYRSASTVSNSTALQPAVQGSVSPTTSA